jgi:hypothetical protein
MVIRRYVVSTYGRSDDEWDRLATAGLEFLVERARLQKVTSYTELDSVLRRRTGFEGFDFSLDRDRAAMGHPLWLIVERNRPETRLMISALVHYLNANDAGSGFYALAADYGLLARNASTSTKLEFWVQQLNAIYAYYRGAIGRLRP